MKERTYEASLETKMQICVSLKKLMAHKPLNKITVSELMEPCGMARQHFYYHFEDINDAVRWMLENEAIAFLHRYEGSVYWQDGLLQLFQYIQDNRAVCLCALHSLGRNHLKRFFQTDLHAITRNNIQAVCAQCYYTPSEVEQEMICRFYVGALVNTMEEFLLGEIPLSPQEIIGFVDRVLQAHIRGARAFLDEHDMDTEGCSKEEE
ncbi:TetR-like C-terminal domain-containing protein [Candidatus Agathobaculum pullicola]|uniref:TetR-like C-terminal domain-containing protein n=1 Tax=Candidatus Agathobaculum pullicola TaxID=2838426 RepID=UPI003F8F66EE